jgi:hypothetical protein
MTYEVTFHTDKILSILFYLKSATKVPGDTPKYYYDAGGLTLNLSTPTVQIMRLTDFVPDDGTFWDKLKQSTNIINYSNKQVGDKESHQDALRGIEDQMKIEGDLSKNEHKFYLTPTSIGVVIWIGHAGGDYIRVEIPR